MKLEAFARVTEARVQRVVGALRARGLPVAPELVVHDGSVSATAAVRARLREAIEALYEKSCAELGSAFLVARAVDARPREVGPYNSLAISTAVLAAIETLSPRYLSAMVENLADIAALQSLPVVEKAPKAGSKRSGRRS